MFLFYLIKKETAVLLSAGQYVQLYALQASTAPRSTTYLCHLSLPCILLMDLKCIYISTLVILLL